MEKSYIWVEKIIRIFKINLIVLKGICQVLKKLNEVKPRRILSARIPKIREEFICSSYSNNLKF